MSDVVFALLHCVATRYAAAAATWLFLVNTPANTAI